MKVLRVAIPVAVLLFLSILTGCETDEAKKPAPLPAQATAPTVTSSTTQKAASAQTPKIQEDPRAKGSSNPVDALIAQAEKQYAAGQANYQAGHLEAAKANFDQAFNTLLSSDLDIRNNEQLQREFDKVVEAVHELEMTALKQGDGFQEQRSEPAPIDEANDVTFPVDPNLRAKAEAEIKTTKSDLPLVMNDQVAIVHQLFLQPAREGHAGARLVALGPLQGHDRADAQAGGCAARPDLPGAGRVRFPATSAVASGSARYVAVHGAIRGALWTGTQLVGRRPAGSGEIHAGCSPTSEGSLRPVWRLVPGDGCLQFRRRHRAARGGAHRVCRLLGAIQARGAAAGNPQLRPDYRGRDHHRQEP